MIEGVHWFALHTRSRHEKVVAEMLWQRGIEVFLPLKEVLSQWKDRRKRVQFPLFPGYLFVRADMSERRHDIIRVPSVASVISNMEGHPLPVPEDEVKAVMTLVFCKLPCDPHPFLEAGDRVRVIRGPLRGLTGVLVEKKSRFRFVITVALIRQAVSCEVMAEDVERI